MIIGAHCLAMPDGDKGHILAPGLKWTFDNADVQTVSFDPSNATLLYYTAGVNEYHVYRYQYDLEKRQGASVDLNVVADDVVVSEANSKTIFAAPGSLTLDGGFTWTAKSAAFKKAVAAATGRPGYRPVKLLSFRGTELRAIKDIDGFPALGAPGGFMVLRSGNSGDTWELVRKFEEHQLYRVFVNPDDSFNVIAVADGAKKSMEIEAIETSDGGSTWRNVVSIPRGDCGAEDVIRSVTQIRSQAGRTLLVGGCNGLWKSQDEGKSWVTLGGIR